MLTGLDSDDDDHDDDHDHDDDDHDREHDHDEQQDRDVGKPVPRSGLKTLKPDSKQQSGVAGTSVPRAEPAPELEPELGRAAVESGVVVGTPETASLSTVGNTAASGGSGATKATGLVPQSTTPHADETQAVTGSSKRTSRAKASAKMKGGWGCCAARPSRPPPAGMRA